MCRANTIYETLIFTADELDKHHKNCMKSEGVKMTFNVFQNAAGHAFTGKGSAPTPWLAKGMDQEIVEVKVGKGRKATTAKKRCTGRHWIVQPSQHPMFTNYPHGLH